MKPVETILEQLQTIYRDAVTTLRNDVMAFGREGTLPDPAKRTDGSYAYPELTLRYSGVGEPKDRSRAFGRLEQSGTYKTTVTRPDMFSDYLAERGRKFPSPMFLMAMLVPPWLVLRLRILRSISLRLISP